VFSADFMADLMLMKDGQRDEGVELDPLCKSSVGGCPGFKHDVALGHVVLAMSRKPEPADRPLYQAE
jgi:hypothetical protein